MGELGASQVSIRHGYIWVEVVGNQGRQEIQQLFAATSQLVAELERTQPKVDAVVDLRRVGTHTLAARLEGKDRLRRLPVRRIAMFGAPLKLRVVVNLIIKGLHIGKRVQVFDNKDEALAWLKE